MEQLRGFIQDWSLESDDRLLRGLQALSDKIIERTVSLEDNLATLNEETRTAKLQLSNTFNKFLMLSSGQFIENRVVKEVLPEQKITNMDEKSDEKVTEKTAKEIVDTYKNALNLGMNAMNYTIKQSELSTELKQQKDQIEAGVPPNLPTCNNDKYNNMPLPYIIGTPEFQQHDDLGLYGAFGDTIFFKMDDNDNILKNDNISNNDNNDNNDSDSGEDYNFDFMIPYKISLYPRLTDYHEPELQYFDKTQIRNFFPDCDDDKIDDIFDYFEDENKLTQPGKVNIAQIIKLFDEEVGTGNNNINGMNGMSRPDMNKPFSQTVGIDEVKFDNDNDNYNDINNSNIGMNNNNITPGANNFDNRNQNQSAVKQILGGGGFLSDSDDSGGDMFQNRGKKNIEDYLNSDDDDDDDPLSNMLGGNKSKPKEESKPKPSMPGRIDANALLAGAKLLKKKSQKSVDNNNSKPKPKPKKDNDPFGSSSENEDEQSLIPKPVGKKKNPWDSDDSDDIMTKGTDNNNNKPTKKGGFFSDDDDDDDEVFEIGSRSTRSKGEAVNKGGNKFNIDVNALKPGAKLGGKKK